MPILKQLPTFPYVVLSFDSIYIKSTLLFDHQNIDGIQKPVPISDFMKSPSLVLISDLIKQVYVIVMTSFDKSISVPLFWKPFSSGTAELDEDIKKVIKCLKENNTETVGICVDGDFSCNKVTSRTQKAFLSCFAFSDYDHLLKSIRNHLCPQRFKKLRRPNRQLNFRKRTSNHGLSVTL